MPTLHLETDQGPLRWQTTSWNPTTGCDRISAGCEHCYALAFAGRLQAMGQARYQNDGDPRTSGPGFGLTLHPDVLNLPRHWKRPRHIFVGSMSDLFHAQVPLEYVQQVIEVMRDTPQHTYQVLTKRARRLAQLSAHLTWPPNVWVGTSVEDRHQVHRVADLQQVQAPVRYLSLEPLIGPLPGLDLRGIGWVTVAGESGPGSRPMPAQWVRDIRDQCVQAGVPFFFLQWGGAGRGNRLLDGRTWNAFPAGYDPRATGGSSTRSMTVPEYAGRQA